ncbi:hypothetical protein HYPSUDRAFT_449771 [Hypholoma sublateritium FD-334 SS-4]|uniref:Uncharacterized protein n=1 Tax=Hypholoma sublateritium (strain FD-334 SS-4) TaxID=945553 RepID=A0A0D2PZT8_HYPSF|nr:hypothetical protein HYPSUDRAFT_449771 [Hypholoma sublateritium FD-334 SS-4]
MIPQHTSADEIVPALDSDFENLSTMSSPVLNSFSPISGSCNDGEDNSTLSDREAAIFDNSATDRGEDVESLPPLQSFVPVIKMLPGLHLKDNTYYAETPLIQEDLKAFKAYAGRVEELVLTDVGRDEHPRVSQDVITRLALIQDVRTPFMSSLKRLDLTSVDEELAYLWLCLTPTLETLVVDRIPPARQPTIAAFLAELVRSAPHLAHLTLGDGIPPSALWRSVRFAHLRELRIDMAPAIVFAFLEAVAALPVLTLFDIDAATTEYTAYTPLAEVAAPDGAAPTPFPRLEALTVVGTVLLMHDLLHRLLPRGVEQILLILVRRCSLPIPAHWSPSPFVASEPAVEAEPADEADLVAAEPAAEAAENVLDMSALPAPPSPALPAEEVDTSLVAEVPFHTYESCGRTYVCQGHRSWSNVECLKCAERQIVREGLAKPVNRRGKQARLWEEQLERQRLEEQRLEEEQREVELRIEEERRQAQRRHEEERRQARRRREEEQRQVLRRLEEERYQAQQLFDANILMQATHFASAIEHILEYASPQSVNINHSYLSSSSTSLAETTLVDPPELSPATLSKLLTCPSLAKLQIENWVLTSINKAFIGLTRPSESPLLMQTLRLPIEEHFNSGVALSTLPLVAWLYPRLLEFQTRVVQCAGAHVHDLELSVTDHGLTTLSIGGEAPAIVDDTLKIAPYICFLFPHLEKITTHDGHGAEGWKSIDKLVKMCQQVRDTDKRNFYLGA